MRAGGVKFDKSADWYQTLEDELMRFPRDKHDDQVDSMAYLGLMIDKMHEAERQMRLDEAEVDPIEEADELAREQHLAGVQRTMSQEKAVQM